MSHYKVIVVEVLSTTYEIWADSEKEATYIAEISSEKEHPHRHECDQDILPPKLVRIDLIERQHDC